MRLHLALISSTLIFSSVAAAKASDVVTLQKKLAPWQPSEISQKGDQITIALPDANITPEVYSLIISNSCTPIWTKDAPSNYLKNINQINVTNKFKAFGYSFENPLNVCKEMGDLMEKPAEVKMLSNTHLYKAK